MAFVKSSLQQAGRQIEDHANEAADSRWVEYLARAGYVAKGIVYGVVGVLAALAAFGKGGETTGTRGAIHEIGSQPFGQVLLGLMAVGLAGYALWRFIMALLDAEDHGTDAEGIVKRIGFFISGLTHAGLALAAVRLMTGSGGGGGTSNETWTARLLAQPFGPWLVAAVGAVIIGVGGYQFYRAYKEKFLKKWNTRQMSSSQRTWGTRVGKFGLSARGVVFVLIGLFLIRAGLQSDASEARGLDGALQALAAQPFGPWLLGLVAFGLIAYGLFAFLQARYRRLG